MSSASFEMIVPVLPGDIDQQNHVNNTVYLRWVQDVATAHWRAVASPAAQENIASNQLASDMHGASLRLNYKAYHETLECEIGAMTWLMHNDWAVRPKISYAFNDRIKGVIGAQLYFGSDDSFFGRLRKTNSGFAELRFNL